MHNSFHRALKTYHSGDHWKVTGQSEGGRYITVKADTGRTVARVPWNTEKEVGAGIDTDNDDARLIAAAPDLLKSLIAAEQVAFDYSIEAEGSHEAERADAVLSQIRTTLEKLNWRMQ